MCDDNNQKVLWITWDTEHDVFSFKPRLAIKTGARKKEIKVYNHKEELIDDPITNLTRRQVLSQINALFDPMGIAAPFIVKAKILLRKTWQVGKDLSWDDVLPEHLSLEWNQIFQELFEMKDVKIRRCVRPLDVEGNPMLIIFSDASEEAFGACAYVSWKLRNGQHASRFFLSKSRLAPQKKISIVRLELCGVLLGVRIKKFIFQHSRIAFSGVKYIVDS